MDVVPTIRTPRDKPAREIYEQYIQSASWRVTRNHALRRAGYRCERCGRNRDVQVHHKTYERLGREWDQDLEVVCGNCHEGIHLEEMKADDRGKLYLKLANDALKDLPLMVSIADASDVVKTLCAKLHIPYDGHQVDKALALLTGQRRVTYLRPEATPKDEPAERPLSRAEAARIWGQLIERGLPLDKLGKP